jgi:hypothetical protein
MGKFLVCFALFICKDWFFHRNLLAKDESKDQDLSFDSIKTKQQFKMSVKNVW